MASQRRPQGGVVVVVGHVEEESLGRADEVGVEHREQFPGGELGGVGEEAAREHLQRQVTGAVGEPEPVEELRGRHPVQRGVAGRVGDAQQPEGFADVDAGQVRRREGRTQRDEADEVPRRGAGHPGEGVDDGGRAVARVEPERVVGHRHQPGEVGVGPPQQASQVVVLAEERVEAAAHGGRPAGHVHRPGPRPAAEGVGGLQQHDLDAALGQPGRRGQAGDAAADHDDTGTFRRPPTARDHRPRRVVDGVAVASGTPGLHAVSLLPASRQQMITAVTSANPNPKSSIGMSKGNRIPRKCSGA